HALAGRTAKGGVLLYELQPGGRLAALPGKTGPPRFLAFSPDGRLLAVLWNDGDLTLCDGLTGKPINQAPEAGAPLAWAGFEADGRLVGGTASGGVLRWPVVWARPARPPALSDRDREEAWAGLGAEEAGEAAGALVRLLDDSESVLGFIRGRLPPSRSDA